MYIQVQLFRLIDRIFPSPYVTIFHIAHKHIAYIAKLVAKILFFL